MSTFDPLRASQPALSPPSNIIPGNLSPLAPRSPPPRSTQRPLPPSTSPSRTVLLRLGFLFLYSQFPCTRLPLPTTRGRRVDRDDDDDDGEDNFSPTRTISDKGGPGAVEQIKSPPPDGFVRMKVVGLEKNRRDVYIKFNAESNLPNFRHSSYRAVSRSYSEFLRFADAIAGNSPQSIIPALPLVQTSAGTEEEDDRLVKVAFQRWIARVTTDAAFMRDDELRNFIESEFGYTPSTRARRKTAPTFHFPRGARLPGEQDDELTLAKAAMGRLELSFVETSRVVERVSRARRAVAIAYVEVGDHLNTFATTETYAPLANGIKKLARATKVSADLLAAQATSEQVTLGDSMLYQSSNARSAKETLVSRDVTLDEHRSAAKSTIAKRRNIERLKGSSSLKSDRVDEALEELDEAQRHETLLAQRLAAISQNLQPSLRTHARHAHEDLLTALVDHARTSVLYERQLLKELEMLRPELHAIKSPTAGVIYQHVAPVSPEARRERGSSLGGQQQQQQGVGALTNGHAGVRSPLPQSPSTLQGQYSPLNGGGRQQEGNMNGGSKSMIVGRSVGGDDLLGVAAAAAGGTTSGGTLGRRSIHSMARSVVVAGDQRQRVDAKMAASMLANGF